MKQYLDLMQRVLDEGWPHENRTGVNTLRVPGAMMQFDLADGFPAITTKQLAFKQVVAELLGFVRGYQNAGQFRALGCKIWDANANDNAAWLANPNRIGDGDLGRIYGVQWRDWLPRNGIGGIDQLSKAVKMIRSDPDSRRNIVTAWNPGELDQVSLPPCHAMFQFIADKKKNALHLCMYQRSCDLFLGVPFNIASYALLLSIVAKMTGYTPRKFTHFLADVHIYDNHMEQVAIQLSRKPHDPPRLWIDDNVIAKVRDHGDYWALLQPEDFGLRGYTHDEQIAAEMAV